MGEQFLKALEKRSERSPSPSSTAREVVLGDPVVASSSGAVDIPQILTSLKAKAEKASTPAACVLIDCTEESGFADFYAHALTQGVSILSANPQSGWGGIHRYRAIKDATYEEGAGRLMKAATLRLGIPLLPKIRELMEGGERLLRLQLLQPRLQQGTSPMSAQQFNAVTEHLAHNLVILAREMGHEISLAQVERTVLGATSPAPLQWVGEIHFEHRNRGKIASIVTEPTAGDSPPLSPSRVNAPPVSASLFPRKGPPLHLQGPGQDWAAIAQLMINDLNQEFRNSLE